MFIVMILSALVGLVLVALGAKNAKQNKIWLAALALGVCCLATSVLLALPK